MKQVSITPEVRALLPKKFQDFFFENLLGIFYPDYQYHSYQYRLFYHHNHHCYHYCYHHYHHHHHHHHYYQS